LLATVAAPVVIPHDRIGLIALSTGCAIAAALEKWGVRASLKWPNDILLGDRKLGGVLIQTRLGEILTALVGIGINVYSAPSLEETEAACLADVVERPPEPRTLLEAIVAHLRQRFIALERGRWADIQSEWSSRAVWLGETIVIDKDGELSGVFVGVDEFGSMIFRTGAEDLLISTSDIMRGPRRAGISPYT
jgi:BirA family biotin operon repressor/biotin-[acetyl-CoA-carboxylase] ligase